jgi:hypothetical protein
MNQILALQQIFTWEREWRIKVDELPLPSGESRIIVPDESFAEMLEEEHHFEEHHYIEIMAVHYGEEYRMLEPEPFQYPYSVIDTV